MTRIYMIGLVLVGLASTQDVSAAAEQVAESQVNQRDENGDTALHRAVRPRWEDYRIALASCEEGRGAYTWRQRPVCCLKTIEQLVLAEADLECKNNEGESVLSMVREKCDSGQLYVPMYKKVMDTIQKARLVVCANKYLPMPLVELVLANLYNLEKAH